MKDYLRKSMKFIRKIFQKGQNHKEPSIKFGRFSDSYKEEEKYLSWDKSLSQYEKKQYLTSFKLFLEYLSNEQENLNYTVTDDKIDFALYQGSKKIVGTATKEKITAEAKIATASDLNIGFLRRLVEQNFGLKYSRYALDENNNITLVFGSYMLDGSPYKMYYALKELSVNADKQDDILLEEFDSLTQINTGHIRNVSEEEKEIKFNLLKTKLKNLFHEVDNGSLDETKYPGGISYLILDTIYTLDYLIRPEGLTMESFERVHRSYFLKDGKLANRKNLDMIKELKKVNERSQSDFYNELYGVKSTFGITAPCSHERLNDLIDGELNNMDWYIQNNHIPVALAIPGYIVGYSLFNYALPEPDKELFHLYIQIFNPKFFKDLKFSFNYRKEQKIQKSNVIVALKAIEKKYRQEFPEMKIDTKSIDFSSEASFAKSYLIMVRNLTVKKIKENKR